MLNSRKILMAFCAVVAAGFVFGIAYLFQLRFSAGDLYPAYSSLRTDPLGAKMFYESLQRLPDLSVRRFYQASSKLEGGPDSALFIFGIASPQLEGMSPEDYRALRSFLYEGGRVVITLLPTAGDQNSRQSENPFIPKDRKSVEKEKKSMSRGSTNTEEAEFQPISLLKTNGLALKTENLLADETGTTHSELAEAVDQLAGLPRLISWHSGAYFDGLTDHWRTIYRRKQRPVIIERSFGRGSLALSTDSYFFSNEALRKERHPELLLWAIGDRKEIIFDETHFGLEEHIGVAALARRYHLEGVVAGLLVLAGLFVWKNHSSLAPPPPEDAAAGQGAQVITGKESSAGFASLLRRSLPPSDMALICFREWMAAFSRDSRAKLRLPQVQKIIDDEKNRPPASRRPVQTYQEVSQILAKNI